MRFPVPFLALIKFTASSKQGCGLDCLINQSRNAVPVSYSVFQLSIPPVSNMLLIVPYSLRRDLSVLVHQTIPSPCVKSSRASPCTKSLQSREDRKRIQTKYFSCIFFYCSYLVCSDAVLGPWYTTTAVSDAAAAAAAACSSAPASRRLAPLLPVRLRLGPDPDPDCCPVTRIASIVFFIILFN
jgi:hypothetical protein